MSDQSLSDIWRTCLPWSNSRATWERRVKAMGDRQTETLRDKWLQQPMQNLQHTKNMFMMLSFSSDHQFWDVLSFVGTFRDFLRFLVFFLRFVLLTIYFLPHLFWMFWGVLRLLDISHLPRWYCICLMCSTCLFFTCFLIVAFLWCIYWNMLYSMTVRLLF